MSLSIYESFELNSNASLEKIEKKYKSLVYLYKRRNDQERLSNLNGNYAILTDKFKRKFYNRFGDEYTWIFSKMEESYFLTRIVDGINIFLFQIAILGFIINTLTLGIMERVSLKWFPLLKNTFYIISALSLCTIWLRAKKHFYEEGLFFSLFSQLTKIYSQFVASLVCISLSKYKLLPLDLNFNIEWILIWILLEILINYNIFKFNMHNFSNEKTNEIIKEVCFISLIRTSCTALSFIHFNPLTAFIPIIISFFFFFLNRILSFIVGIFFLPISISLLLINCNKLIWISWIIDGIYLIIPIWLYMGSRSKWKFDLKRMSRYTHFRLKHGQFNEV